MKRILSLLLLLALVLCGCSGSANDAPNDAPAGSSDASFLEEADTPECLCDYSNLTDEASRQEVDDALAEAGVSPERRKVLWDHDEQFLSAVEESLLVGDFQVKNILAPAYDPYDYQDQWTAQHPDFGGYNCRITAFGLMGDHITVSDEAELRDSGLFMDLESLEADPSALLEDGDLDKFRRLFSVVPTENTTDTAVHMENIRRDWAERGVTFREDDKLSLVTVWFHDQWSPEENELFIGHTGVLAETENGLYFVEKLAFQEPYQAIRLRDRDQLRDYLLARYDVAWGQETARPFIMENLEALE